jgi:hypothetical protein
MHVTNAFECKGQIDYKNNHHWKDAVNFVIVPNNAKKTGEPSV